MRRRWAAVLTVFAALAAGSTATPADDEGEDVTEPLPWHADEGTIFLRRIVDAATGKPVAGATVRLFCEVPHPEPGFGTPLATATSGADGYVRLHQDDVDRKLVAVYGEPTWAYVDAAGLRPDALFQGTGKDATKEFLANDPDWTLGPATTIRVALRDPLDRPVPDALVGWLLGCGHTPDVRQARTGADGVAVLERTAPYGDFGQIWPVKAGFRSAYVSADGWAPWERPRVAALEWGDVVEGTVLAHDGKPAAGVGVGLPDVHRGPWTRTDADGRFRLIGAHAAPGESIVVEAGEYPVTAHAPRDGLVTACSFPVPPTGHRATIRLPDPGKEPAAERDAVRLVVEVDPTGWPKSKAKPSIVVHAVRVEDGWTASDFVGEQGVALLDVRPGAYAIEAVGELARGSIVYSRAQADVTVPTTGGAYLRVAMPAPALQPLEISWPDAAPLIDEVAIVADGATTILGHSAEEGRSFEVLLPTDRAVSLRMKQGARTSLTPINRASLKAGERGPVIAVKPFPTVEITARFVDMEGKAANGWLFEPDEHGVRDPEHIEPPAGAARETARVSTLAGGPVVLVAWPEDLVRFQPSLVDVPTIPPIGTADGKPLDLGALRLAPRAPGLRVEKAAFRPIAHVTVRVTNGDRAADLVSENGVRDPWGAPGLLAAGALARVIDWGDGAEAEKDVEHVPFTRRLEGPGPWTIRPPAGSAVIEPRDDAGAPLPTWSVVLDGNRYDAEGSRLRLAGLEAGPHRLLVDATGKVPKQLHFTLADGETRTWAPRLRPAVAR